MCCLSFPWNISLAGARCDVCHIQQLGPFLSSPALSDDEQMAAAGWHSSGQTATAKLSLAAEKVAGQDLPGDLSLAWTSTENKIPELACSGRGYRKAAGSQSFAKYVRGNWQGEPSASSSCNTFDYLGEGTTLESTPSRCFTKCFQRYSIISQSFLRGNQIKIWHLPAQGRNAQKQFHLIAVASADK